MFFQSNFGHRFLASCLYNVFPLNGDIFYHRKFHSEVNSFVNDITLYNPKVPEKELFFYILNYIY